MDPLVRYYLHQAGRGHTEKGIGPIYMYSNPPFLQRRHEIGSILCGLWPSFVRPLLWHGTKIVGSEALATGRNILTEMANPTSKFRVVVRRKLRDSAY